MTARLAARASAGSYSVDLRMTDGQLPPDRTGLHPGDRRPDHGSSPGTTTGSRTHHHTWNDPSVGTSVCPDDLPGSHSADSSPDRTQRCSHV